VIKSFINHLTIISMKKMFIVMAVLISCLTQSFTFSNRAGAAFGTLNSANTGIGKWQQTTWVNPFAVVKKLPTNRQSLQNVDMYCGLGRDMSPSLIYFRVYVNNVLQIDWSIYALGQASAYAGDTVKIEISTTPPDGGPDVTVQDANGIIFSQNDPAINFTTFSFVAQAGHYYYISSIM
jgi:hypothetical protein